jgi:hypothetical protein
VTAVPTCRDGSPSITRNTTRTTQGACHTVAA